MKRTADGRLPLELLLDILLRLEVKFLCRCKCVSKTWCSLIESPSFVKEHFEQERNRERLLIQIWERNHEVHNANEEPDQNGEEVIEEDDQEVDEHELYIQEMVQDEEYYRQEALKYDGDYKCAFYVDETFSEYETPSHLQMPDVVTDLYGPLNGVFCVVAKNVRGRMGLLNPASRQFKPLPLVQQYPENLGLFDVTLGLGFDPLTGDYKLVVLQGFFDVRSEEQHCSAYVCTSDSDSWTLLENMGPIFSGRHVSRSFGLTYLSGLHNYFWLMEFDDHTGAAILAFDMKTDKFRKFPVPSHVAQHDPKYLASCEDSLDLLVYDANERCIDVWRMVNEGSWTRRSRVGPLVGFAWPLCFWKNDELLLETETDEETPTGLVTLCHTSTQKSKILHAQNADQQASKHWAIIYKESLVSVKGEAGWCKLWDPSSDFIKSFFKGSSNAWCS